MEWEVGTAAEGFVTEGKFVQQPFLHFDEATNPLEKLSLLFEGVNGQCHWPAPDRKLASFARHLAGQNFTRRGFFVSAVIDAAAS